MHPKLHKQTLKLRSNFEKRVIDELDCDFKYEEYKIDFIVPARQSFYVPDLILPNNVIVEIKGLWTVQDRHKHLLLQEQFEDLDVHFLFQNQKTKIHKKSQTTYQAYCEKHGFTYSQKVVPKDWLEKPKRQLPNYVVARNTNARKGRK